MKNNEDVKAAKKVIQGKYMGKRYLEVFVIKNLQKNEAPPTI